MRRQEVENMKLQSANIFTKLVWKIHEVARGKVHNHEIEVCQMSNQFRRFKKLVDYFGNISWKVHELAWNLHEIDFAPRWVDSSYHVRNNVSVRRGIL
jgi:hypothetical protein